VASVGKIGVESGPAKPSALSSARRDGGKLGISRAQHWNRQRHGATGCPVSRIGIEQQEVIHRPAHFWAGQFSNRPGRAGKPQGFFFSERSIFFFDSRNSRGKLSAVPAVRPFGPTTRCSCPWPRPASGAGHTESGTAAAGPNAQGGCGMKMNGDVPWPVSSLLFSVRRGFFGARLAV